MSAHLTLEKRIKIRQMLNQGFSKARIADVVGCSPSTIYREIKRTGDDYDPYHSEEICQKKLKTRGMSALLKNAPMLRSAIKHYIVDMGKSPEEALKSIKDSGREYEVEIRSVNTVYSAIRNGLIEGVTTEDLHIVGPALKRKRLVKLIASLRESLQIINSELDEKATEGHNEYTRAMETLEYLESLI